MNELEGLEDLEELEGIQHFQKVFLFNNLTYDETKRLGALCEEVIFPDGTRIIEADSLGEALYILRSGNISVRMNDQHIATLGEGELFGEMSLVDDLLTSADVIAVGEVRALKIPRVRFDEFMRSDTAMALKVYRSFCRILSERLRQANRLFGTALAVWPMAD